MTSAIHNTGTPPPFSPNGAASTLFAQRAVESYSAGQNPARRPAAPPRQAPFSAAPPFDAEAEANRLAYLALGRRASLHETPEKSQVAAFLSPPAAAFVPAAPVQAADAVPGQTVSPGNADQPADPASKGRHSAGIRSAEEARTPERAFLGGASGGKAPDEEEDDSEKNGGTAFSKLSEEERKQVREMKDRDQEVRAHEQAHISAGGSLVTGGASYQKERGPDGAMYAVGGEVQIDTSEGASPDESIAKARRIKAAALAPATPSAQDHKVAAQAAQMEASARQDKSAQIREERQDAADKNSESGGEGLGEAGEAGETSAAPQQARSIRRAGLSYARAAGETRLVPHGYTLSTAG